MALQDGRHILPWEARKSRSEKERWNARSNYNINQPEKAEFVQLTTDCVDLGTKLGTTACFLHELTGAWVSSVRL